MHKIFISYSRADYDKVMILKNEIEQLLGVGSCWVDLDGIESDQQFVDVIIDAIDKADIFLFMYSPHSDSSEWTRKEINYAHSEKKRIVFVKLENVQLSKYFRFQFGEHDIIDLQDKKQKEKLLKNLQEWNVKESGMEQQVHEKKEQKDSQNSSNSLFPFSSQLGFVEVLLFVSAFVFVINFIIGLPLFLGVNYKYRDYLSEKYPRYWKVISNKKRYIYLLLGINVVLSFFLFCFSCQEYDGSLLIVECVLFVLSVLFGYFCLYSSFSLKYKKKYNGVILFGLPVLFYFCSILLSLYNKTESHVVSPNVAEVQDNIARSEVQTETNGEITDSVCDYGEIEKDNVHNSKIEYCFRGSFDKKESEMRITDVERLKGYIEQVNTRKKLYLSMWLNKRSLEGTVENEDGKNVGYVDCMCEVKDSLLTINGELTMLKSDNYDYSTHKISYSGIVPPSLLVELAK